MGLIDSIRSWLAPAPVEERMEWPFANLAGGGTFPFPWFNQTLQGTKEEIGSDFEGLANGTFKANPVVFACMNARASLFSEARFMYRQVRSGTPGELFSLPALDILRHPWPNGTTGDLLARTMQDNDLAGNAFWLRKPTRLVRLRPDWVTIVHGSRVDPDMTMWDPEAELIGYLYQPGGPGGGQAVRSYLPNEVAHFAPVPDPTAPARGISWLTSLIREVAADSQMTTHKQAYLTNGATPNLVVTGVPGDTIDKYREWVDSFSKKHDGAANAYRSLYLTAAMDAKVLGSNLSEIDFKAVQGAGETRIATAAGVPAAVVGISEGLAGSSLNAGNFSASMRRFADLTMRTLWRNACGSFETIVSRPGDSELWYDDRDIPALKDDITDRATVQQLQAGAARQYVDGGYDPATVIDALVSGDLKRLKHTGLYSVQLQPPGTTTPTEPTPPPPEPEPKRDAALTGFLLASERWASAAENREPTVINVTTPEIRLPEQAAPQITFERGAVEVSSPVTVEPAVVNVTTPEVRNEITVEPTPLEVTVEAPAVEVRNEIAVEPTPIEVTVEAPSVQVTNEIEAPAPTTRRVVRDAAGLITDIVEEATDG